MPNNSWLIKALTLASNVLRNNAVKITSVGGPGGYPSVIPNAIEADPATVSETEGRVTVSTSNKGDDRNADITIAFELGSGLTGPKRQRYPIRPKNPGGVLHFPWSEAQNIRSRKFTPSPILGTDPQEAEAYLPMVMHPGIRPRPFLQKGLEASKDELDAIILGEFEGYLLEILP